MARILQLSGITKTSWQATTTQKLADSLEVRINNEVIATLGAVAPHELKRFDIKQPVFFADIDWELLLKKVAKGELRFTELPKQLPVHRDLAMIVPKTLPFADVESTVRKVQIGKLQEVQLFDIFESGKIGADKKSLAISFTFLDEEKTLTDKEIDGMMNKIMTALEKDLQAEIRK